MQGKKGLFTVWTAVLLSLMAAVPQQETAPNIPWWGWLVVISILLLLLFIIVLRMDWGGAANKDDNE